MTSDSRTSIFDILKKLLQKVYYFSPSYYYYMIIEIKNITEEKDDLRRSKLKEIKRKVSEIMKYFFYFIDLVFILLISFKNTIYILKHGLIIDKMLYIFITSTVILLLYYCIYKINSYVSDGKKNNNSDNLIEKIIEINGYKVEGTELWNEKISKYIKCAIIKFSLRETAFLGILMVIFWFLGLLNKNIEIIVAVISVFYFIMRPLHYCVVFYKDFRNKIDKRIVETTKEKMRYIVLALSNYVKIILEFCILIYVLKYMGWAFVNIEINTFFELVYLVLSGDLKANTSIEMFIDLVRIVALGMVITLNLATYMGLETGSKSVDNKIHD